MGDILLNIPQIQFPHMGIYAEMEKKQNPACRNAYVVRDTMLYELFIGTVSHVNTEENKEWKITLELNRDPVTVKFDTWSPSQHTARTKKKYTRKSGINPRWKK